MEQARSKDNRVRRIVRKYKDSQGKSKDRCRSSLYAWMVQGAAKIAGKLNKRTEGRDFMSRPFFLSYN
jgi:hypothetical protein